MLIAKHDIIALFEYILCKSNSQRITGHELECSQQKRIEKVVEPVAQRQRALLVYLIDICLKHLLHLLTLRQFLQKTQKNE